MLGVAAVLPGNCREERQRQRLLRTRRQPPPIQNHLSTAQLIAVELGLLHKLPQLVAARLQTTGYADDGDGHCHSAAAAVFHRNIQINCFALAYAASVTGCKQIVLKCSNIINLLNCCDSDTRHPSESQG